MVVDEGSSDETPEGLADLDDPRVRVSRHERRVAWRRRDTGGIAEARGEWVGFLDDDDVWSARKLRAPRRELDTAASSRWIAAVYQRGPGGG